jgi:16S rRNA (uracil1498-N3)-methyltransferase
MCSWAAGSGTGASFHRFMRVFILPQDSPVGKFVDLTGEDHHYLARVRRVKVGDRFLCGDSRGGRWLCTVVRIGPESLRLRLEQAAAAPDLQQYSVRLIQCLPKAAKMDLIVRQATEMGVAQVRPVYSRFSQVKPGSPADDKEADKKCERWRRIARQAVQQSGAARVPDIEAPRALESLLQELGEAGNGEVRLFFHQDRETADTLHGCLSKSLKIITLVVGPEGGLSAEEVSLLRSKGFVPITVGQTVLRTETAALYAIAAIQIVIQERNAWAPT